MPDSLVAASGLYSNILVEKILIRSDTDVCPSSKTTLLINDRRKTAFINVQSRTFFDCARFPTSTQSRTSMTGRRIFFLNLVKARLASMETTVVDSIDTARVKALTFPWGGLLPT